MGVDYVIISKPSHIKFRCPHCNEYVDVSFENVDYKTDCWSDGAWVDCSCCGKEVELDNWEYD